MAFTKYASLEHAQVLELRSSPSRMRHASLGKMADFNQYRTDDGYLYARIRAISSRINKNYDGWPSIELAGGQDIFDRHLSSTDGFTLTADSNSQYGFSTFANKPIFLDHHNSDPSRTRGAIVDSVLHVEDHRTAAADSYYSSADVDPEHLPGTWVELLLEVDAKAFPKFAKAIVEGSRNPKKGIDGWSMGCDVEKSVCSICKNAASQPDDYCNHIRMKGAYFDHVDPRTGRKTSKRAYENCYGVKFFEISGVFDPADETALSREVRSSADPSLKPIKDKSLKDLADEQAEDLLDETAEGIARRKKQDKKGAYEDDSDLAGGAHYDGQWNCPECGWGKYHQANEFANSDPTDTTRICADCGAREKQAIGGDGFSYPPLEPADATTNMGVGQYGTPHQGSVKLAENPLPQSEMSHAPEKVDTLREESICPVCGSSMDEDTCAVCGYEEPPDGFGNPDLTKAQDVDVPTAPEGNESQAPQAPPTEPGAQAPEHGAVNTPMNPTSLAHVTSDMDWDVHTKTSARINKVEQPIVGGNKPQTDEPTEKILSDQLRPVTSRVRTAEQFIAAAGATRRNAMNHTAEAASGAPAVAKPDVNTDVMGVGGVDQASNDAASKADAQVDVTGIGGVGVEGVAAEQEGVNVEQGDEHSKNIEAIPTKTWHGDKGQQSPVTSQPFPASADGVHASSWVVESYDDSAFPGDEIEGGSAVKGVQPIAESFGDRVDVLDHVTSPANNSGPTTTWTGTDGNGVNKQQDPVTNDSIALGESGMEGAPNWTSSTHIFTAFKLARLETTLGMISSDNEFARAAELERESPEVLAASLRYAQRIRQASIHKTTGATKLPVMGRTTSATEPSVEDTSTDDDSFMFGGL